MSKKSPSAASQPDVLTLPRRELLPADQALEAAARQIDEGRLQSAEGLVQQVLQQQPGNPFAIHLLGIIAHHVGRTELAAELIGKAIDILPSAAQFHRNRGEMCRLLKRLDEAVAHGERAAALAPADAIAHSNLGIAYYDRRDFEKAEACQQRALEIDPRLVQALNNFGSIRRDTRDKEGALAYYRQALALAPDTLEARNNLAAVLTELERPEEALAELTKVVAARPQYADAHCNVGNAFLHLEQFDKAAAAFAQALALTPDAPAAMRGLARVCCEQDRLEEATVLAERAIALEPDKADGHTLAGDVHAKAERYDLAEAAYRKALAIDPQAPAAQLGIGQLWLELGKMDEAQAAFQHAMDEDPKELSPHVFMAQARKIKADDPCLARLEAEAAHVASLPATKAMSLHFALGKAYDDLKEYDKAFPHFLAGCRLKRARVEYDADNQDLACRNIRELFTRETIERLSGAGDPSDLPIFVLGMPRSGTTLVETIIASHPDVFGAGELRDLLDIANRPREDVESPGFPLSMAGVARADLERLGARYAAGLRARAPTARRITDKMPANFLALGLIHLMLPNARIVHLRRNAADVSLSGFTKLFNRSQYHSYDLAEMGRYYAAYARLMEHWRQVLPAGAFLDVQYEELVADREAQTRRLIDFCGLEWHDACLEHHKTERSVKTASITQVRQPVYNSSVERWRHYEQFLQPLLDALGEYAPAR